MANRHLSRQIVLQTLFEWDFREKSQSDVMSIFSRNKIEFSEGVADEGYMDMLMESVLEKQKDLDEIIKKAAPEWPLEKISTVDRNILRIGLYELLFADREQVPPKVAINEAIELAKSFGGNTSGKFVNGVLGAVYKEMGEPGKDDQPRKKKIKNIPDEEAPIENLYGAVVYAEHEGEKYLALVHDIFGHWTLSKGHSEGASAEEEVKRIIKEEIGLDIEPAESLGKNEYIAYDPEKGKIRKRVEYLLARAEYGELKMPESGGLDNVKWFKLQDILDLNFYDDILPLVTKAVQSLTK